ncbi:hypothetical protein DL765_005656 [Monosporascus sp. GIB2]|nr:hypothetical protein DL765_005656 [Monosporascus sp. GIB2]
MLYYPSSRSDSPGILHQRFTAQLRSLWNRSISADLLQDPPSEAYTGSPGNATIQFKGNGLLCRIAAALAEEEIDLISLSGKSLKSSVHSSTYPSSELSGQLELVGGVSVPSANSKLAASSQTKSRQRSRVAMRARVSKRATSEVGELRVRERVLVSGFV